MSERLTDAAIREAQAREKVAHKELMRVTGMGDWWCKRGEIRAHIPADPKRDTDLVIGASLQDVNALAAEALARGEEVDAALDSIKRILADQTEERAEASALRAEVARLRAEAIPEDAEEIAAQAMWTHDEWGPPTLAEADASNLAKVRAGAMIYRDRARAVLAALRRQA